MKDQPVPAEVRRRVGVSIAVPHHLAGAGALMVPRSALSREVGVATEMLLTKAEQVWDDGAPPGYAFRGHEARPGRFARRPVARLCSGSVGSSRPRAYFSASRPKHKDGSN